MNDFVTVPLSEIRLDPSKRVNYTLGLVLGVDEFKQEQTYFLEKDRLHNRSMHGYGTVHGLQVHIRKKETTGEPEIVVCPGMAVDQLGRNICITEAQCASVNTWLDKYKEKITGPDRLSIYVVLCYRECETDQVPIPGGPCRTQEESMEGSRIAEDFELRLTLNKPPQIEENSIRKFGQLLHMIEITDEPGDFLTESELIDLVRKLGDHSFILKNEHYRIHPEHASAWLRTAFRIWVTDVRTSLLSQGHCGGTLGDLDQPCILLAELDTGIEEKIGGGYQAILQKKKGEEVPDVVVDESSRPYLLSTRLLQEWMLFGGFRRETIESQAFATLDTIEVGNEKSIIRVWVHFPTKLKIRSRDIALRINGEDVSNPIIRRTSEPEIYDLLVPKVVLKDSDRVVVEFNAKTIKETNASSRTLLEILEEEDDLYLYRYGNKLFSYLIVDWPTLDDLADVDAAEPSEGNALVWSESIWHPGAPSPGGPAGGDLSGEYPDPSVKAIQGRTVAKVTDRQISEGDILTWDSRQNHWEPRQAQTPGDFVDAPAGSFAIIAAGYFSYNSNKDQVIEVSPPYNQLQAERISVGHYRLHFPYRSAPSKYPPSYIVKATCIKPTRKKTSDEIKKIFPKSIPDQGIIQVSEKPHTTFEVWISQPVIDGKKLKKILDGKESYTNVFEYKLVDFPFMIEVSLYGSRIPGLIKGRVDINKASIEELIDLPVLGEELAKRIDQRRKEIGPFKTIDELDAIQGISPAGVNRLRGHFKIEGKSP